MIARHLPESFAPAIDVCAAIAHVDDISGRFDQQRRGDGSSQIDVVFFPVLVNGLVRPVRTIHQRIYQKFLGKLLAVLDGRQYVLHHTMCSQVTRHLSTGMTTHTISYHKQGKRHKPSIRSTDAALNQHSILIRLVLAYNTRVPTNSNVLRPWGRGRWGGVGRAFMVARCWSAR